MTQLPAFIPSPSESVWQLGPFPLRAYAMCIIVGIFLAVWLTNRRFIARGGIDGQVTDIAMWAVPFGIAGGRIYHVLTDWEIYFSEGGKGFLGALRIWEGGLGIWGAIALGGVGAWIGAKRQGVAFAPFADSVAPGIAFAQAIGRFGNWFNQELFGRPTTLPWGLEIDIANRPTNFTLFETFHPTFLYEAIACIAIGLFLMPADRRYVMGHGRVFALYVAMYCAARGLIETLRIDDARLIFEVRFNVFTSLVIGAGALLYLVRSSEKNPGREVLTDGKLVLQSMVAGSTPQSDLELDATQSMPIVAEATLPQEIVAEATLPQEIVAEATPPQEIVAESTPPQEIVAESTPPQEIVAELTPPQEIVAESTLQPDLELDATRPMPILVESLQPQDIVAELVQPEKPQSTQRGRRRKT